MLAATATQSVDAGLPVWGALLGVLAVMIVVDLKVGSARAGLTVRTAATWSAIWIALSVAFGAVLWAAAGADAGESYFAGYVMEKALSLDNVFVFTLIFAALSVPRDQQARLLLYGILIALVLRAGFIFARGRGPRSRLLGRVPVRRPAGLDGLPHPALGRRPRRGSGDRRAHPAAGSDDRARRRARLRGPRGRAAAGHPGARRAGRGRARRRHLRRRLGARHPRDHDRHVRRLRGQRLRPARAAGAVLPGLRARRPLPVPQARAGRAADHDRRKARLRRGDGGEGPDHADPRDHRRRPGRGDRGLRPRRPPRSPASAPRAGDFRGYSRAPADGRRRTREEHR